MRRIGEHPLRRDGDQQLPAGPKALQTRSRLLEAARDLFIEQGYGATSVSDVARRAGASLGTFYQYFADVSDVLGVLILEHVVSFLEQAQVPIAERRAPSLEEGIEAFVASYSASAALSSVWEEASHTDERAAGLRRDLVRVYTESTKQDLLAASEAGLIRALDEREAALVARALTAMIDRFCYLTYVFDRTPDAPTPAEAARVLSGIWSNSVQLGPAPDEPAPGAARGAGLGEDPDGRQRGPHT